MRLVADENIVGLDALPDGVEVVSVPGRAIDRQILSDADALWVRSVTTVSADLLAGSPVRFVGTATAGLEHVDREALAERGVAFAAAPGANAMAVVEYVLAAMLHLRRPWERLEAGACLGIVGHGHVGRRLSAFARGMGWHVRVCDPWVARTRPAAAFVDMPAVLDCDVISLHCSLHDALPWPSRHLVDAAALRRLKRDAWLINAARGAVIDNDALLAHLARSPDANVVLDVWEREPEIAWALFAQESLRLGTPHIAGYSWDAKWAATRLLAGAMRRQGLLPGDLKTVSVPAPPLAALEHTRGVGSVDAAGALMAACYDIGRDDAALRVVSQMAPEARAAAFDALRRDYPLRRELGALASTGEAAHANDAGGRFLQALAAAAAADST